MAENLIKFNAADLKKIRSDALIAFKDADIRGLLYTSKWLSELAMSLEAHFEKNQQEDSYQHDAWEISAWSNIAKEERTKHAVAMSYYNLKEYKRAEHLTVSCKSKPVQFLHYYCKYMAGESMGSQTELFFEGKQENEESREHLVELCSELTDKYKDNELDAYLLYIYGVVLKKSGYTEDAHGVFLKSIALEPCLWSAWYELCTMIDDRNDLSKLSLPDHWMKNFFLAHAYLDLQLGDYSATIYSQLLENGFSESSYVIAQLAMAYDNTKNVDMAKECFVDVRKKDPYRLDSMDTYSNVLYVKDMREDLADLAAKCIAIDKYRAETCCVIGNYYSIREQHEHAARYFQRALKLNPKFISAWTLMGHEYMEMNNQSAAIQAYRQALDVDSRDFRAWYGLGQTHEILKMHHYSLYYYQQALKLRPSDSRMLMAVGFAYKLLNKPQQAKICFWKAHMIGDPEGIALTHLAKLHEALKEDENAAAAYTKFVLDSTQSGMSNPNEMAHAYKFLANYNLKIKNHEEAYIAAQKCRDYTETREEGKALLLQITKTSGIPANSTGLVATDICPQQAHDSLTEELFNRTSATPAPHLSPRNLRFMTPDH